ncbi:MAG: histidine phosphatase family protein [Candidatus Thorarchaeota archaeon]|nr:MAG: histidine phosphatase family protein [Candidatus Thorarchaeota archaeon]
MSKELYFLRHAETSIVYELPPSKWPLSGKGREQAVKLALLGTFDEVDVLISSEEPKAYQTAGPLAIKCKVPIIQDPYFNELNRDHGLMMTTAGYRQAIHRALVNPDHEELGWEKPRAALKRFLAGVANVESRYNSDKILVVSHGVVLTLYFSHLLGIEEHSPERWDNLGFCDWGLVRDGQVERDLAQ